MYIWLLERVEPEWLVYDEAFGFVVVAKTEEDARKAVADKWGCWEYDADEVIVTAVGKASKRYTETTVLIRDFLSG